MYNHQEIWTFCINFFLYINSRSPSSFNRTAFIVNWTICLEHVQTANLLEALASPNYGYSLNKKKSPGFRVCWILALHYTPTVYPRYICPILSLVSLLSNLGQFRNELNIPSHFNNEHRYGTFLVHLNELQLGSIDRSHRVIYVRT